jgi:nucleoside-diphosphate-sugar epimerase
MLKQGIRVLIAGGAGFIGSHLARALSLQSCYVRVLDDLSTGKRERLAGIDGIELLQGDVRNPAAVQRAMQGMHAAVHLAGVQPGVDPIRAQDVNLGGALHILAAAREATLESDGGETRYLGRERPRVVLCGSASVYGRQTAFVLHEELAPRPMTPEAVMALAMEQYGRVYRETYNVPVVNLRIFRVFGPYEDDARPDAGIVAQLVKAALDGTSPIIHGDGQQTRDLVYIDNVVAAIIAALTVEDPPAEPLNIASGEAVAINFLWNLVLESCGKKRLAIDPTYIAAPPWEPKHARPQIARACKVLGWAPAMRLREGLARTIEHYQGLRNQDPNAWFAPREEAGPKRKLGFPSLPVPTRRFGSVVTPMFGAADSSASPLPTRSSASPLPMRGSASSLPMRSSSPPALPPPSHATPPPSHATPPPLPLAARHPLTAEITSPPHPTAPPTLQHPVMTSPPNGSAHSAPPLVRAHHDEIVEACETDFLEDRTSDVELDLEWAPVPALPGLGG